MLHDKVKKNLFYGLTGGAAGLIIGAASALGAIYWSDLKISSPQSSTAPAQAATDKNQTAASEINPADLTEAVIPSAGVVLPVSWGDLGRQLAEKGVIDRDKFLALYNGRAGLSANELKLLDESGNGKLIINSENSGVILNLLWALGLANKNPILDNGPMVDPRYGGAGNFASTGGWTISRGSAMNHYSQYSLIKLTADQQALVERVAKNIYRPCCGNSTYFPDCNHGLAMLGLLELMASQGVAENDMYKAALQVNSYWFPDTYLTLAAYQAKNNISWQKTDPKQMLGINYSSASGYNAIKAQVQPIKQSGGGSCGV